MVDLSAFDGQSIWVQFQWIYIDINGGTIRSSMSPSFLMLLSFILLNALEIIQFSAVKSYLCSHSKQKQTNPIIPGEVL